MAAVPIATSARVNSIPPWQIPSALQWRCSTSRPMVNSLSPARQYSGPTPAINGLRPSSRLNPGGMDDVLGILHLLVESLAEKRGRRVARARAQQLVGELLVDIQPRQHLAQCRAVGAVEAGYMTVVGHPHGSMQLDARFADVDGDLPRQGLQSQPAQPAFLGTAGPQAT